MSGASGGSISPPCEGGGELFPIGKPYIWDLPNTNYDNINHTFTIPKMVERTLMTIDFHIDIWFDSINASRVNTISFWIGKNIGPNPAVEGGRSGKLGRNYVERQDGSVTELEGTDSTEVHEGDVYVIETPGGGGYGPA